MNETKLKPMRVHKIGNKTTQDYNQWITYIFNSLNNYKKYKTKIKGS